MAILDPELGVRGRTTSTSIRGRLRGVEAVEGLGSSSLESDAKISGVNCRLAGRRR